MAGTAPRIMSDFIHARQVMGLPPLRQPHRIDVLPAPHTSKALPSGKCAIYMFCLGTAEDVGIVLKVGKVGPNSNNRFQFQHYSPASAGSTIAGSLLRRRVLWPYLGVVNAGLTEATVGSWLKTHTSRIHVYLDASDQDILGDLETYMKAMLGPVFEG